MTEPTIYPKPEYCPVCGFPLAKHTVPCPPTRRLAALPSSQSAPDGVLRLSVDIAVDVSELATWPPGCVAAFMAGIAQCLAAQSHAREFPNAR